VDNLGMGTDEIPCTSPCVHKICSNEHFEQNTGFPIEEVYYESIMREVKRRPIYECRQAELLKLQKSGQFPDEPVNLPQKAVKFKKRKRNLFSEEAHLPGVADTLAKAVSGRHG